jgi:hypothetical protein
MFTIPELAADALGSHLAAEMGNRFGSTEAGLIERVQSAARLAIDCIGGSDALYHNVEHTMLVTLVGFDILRGRQLLVETSASDFEHFIVACLFHDIGYVRGILKGDSADGCIIDAKGNKVKLPRGSSDAALMPYRVDRSKLFVMDRVARIKSLDAVRIVNAIECTRHGAPDSDGEEGTLVRAANLLGQLADPQYLRKANALYYEFEEVGRNKQFGYTSPADLTDLYPKFYWSSVSAHIRAPCATSTSRRTDGGGLPIYTAISFAPSASQASRAHNGKIKAPRLAQSPKTNRRTCCRDVCSALACDLLRANSGHCPGHPFTSSIRATNDGRSYSYTACRVTRKSMRPSIKACTHSAGAFTIGSS